MSDHVYKSVELTGSSPDSIQKAIENALVRASDTIRNIRWIEIAQVRGQVEGNKVAHWQVTMKLGFTLED